MIEKTVIVGVADYCRNFPQRPKKSIPRENLYEHVNSSFQEASRIVLLEGGELSGKTEFLAGYMDRNPENSIGVFLTPGDAYFYTPEYLRLVISEQIHWLLEKSQSNFDLVDQSMFQKLILRLQKNRKKNIDNIRC